MSTLLSQIPVVYQPIQNNKFVVKFPSELGIQSWMVSSSGMPSYSLNAVEIPWMNTSTFVAGRYTWEDIEVTFRSLIGPSTAQILMEWIRLCTESVTARQGYAAAYKKDFTIEMLDPSGVTIQKWLIKNAFITKASFGANKYDDDNISEISCTFKYDYAINVF